MIYWHTCNNAGCLRPVLTSKDKMQCFDCRNGRPPFQFRHSDIVFTTVEPTFAHWINTAGYEHHSVWNGNIIDLP